MLTVAASCGEGKARVEFTQQRFFLSPERLNAGSPEQWQIPVCMKSGTNTPCSLVASKTQEVPIAQCPTWLFANRDAKGYYRVAYTKTNLNAVAGMAESELNAPERIALIEDAWAMTRVGKTSIGDFLGLAQALRSGRDLAAIDLLAADLADVGDLLVPENEARDYREFVHKQFNARAKELGWAARADDSDEQKAMRASLLGILGRTGDPEAVATARALVQNYLRNPASVEGNSRGPSILDRCRARGCSPVRADQCGTVESELDGRVQHLFACPGSIQRFPAGRANACSA